MKKIINALVMAILVICCGISVAEEIQPKPIPISAEEAFDSVQTQTDPITGESKRIVLIDVRTRAEYFWLGTAGRVVDIITTTGESIAPDHGKAVLAFCGRFLKFKTGGKYRLLELRKVSRINLEPIALNRPYRLWDEAQGITYLNPDFTSQVEALAADYDVLVLFCRSGGRSEDSLGAFETSLFHAIYEIDQPDGQNGIGGFEGSSYSNIYNGYRGYPGRFTAIQDHPSVAWKDAGLPIIIGVDPIQQ